MSSFYRKGTVSKVSGPIHSNSYAMRGVAVRYKPPIFVPELLQLPADWVKPTLPSSRVFTYDYSLEKRVSEHARHRAISIAAEASLQRKQVLALQKHQQEEAEDGPGEAVGASDSSPPQQSAPSLLLLLGSNIMTPTPVAPPTSQSFPTVGGGGGEAQQSTLSSGEGGSASSLLEDDSKASSDQAGKSDSAFKSLGNWSIKEFEGGAMDPFEITSLQAINDMEELQSVLQPSTKMPQTVAVASPASASSPSVVMSRSQVPGTLLGTSHQSSPSPAINLSTVPNSTAATTVTHATSGPFASPTPTLNSNSSPELRPNSAAQMPRRKASDGSVEPLRSTSPQLVAQTHFSPQVVPALTVESTNLFQSGLPPPVTGNNARRNSNPFLNSEPSLVPNHHPHPHFTAPVAQTQQQQQQQQLPQDRSQSEPGVGTLVDLGADHTHPRPPVPVPRTSPKLQQGAVPIPKPRKGSPAPSGRGVVQPPAAAATTPPLPPKGNIHSTNPGGSSSPMAATRIVGSSSPSFPSTHNPVRMGVAVLPPITPASLSHPSIINEPPPAYKLRATPPTARQSSPPPPYSSPGQTGRQQPHVPALTPPTVARKIYVLPNPEASLTTEQRKHVVTIASMGFPPQRVGRAIIRYEDDQTKVLDFLFLVGELEDAKYNGNSAEMALVACEDNLEKAKEYLQKLNMYKEIGFQEKAIHEAYTKADKGDWDKIIDILTRSR